MPQLKVGNLETLVPFNRCVQHGQSILRGRLDVVGLQRCLGGRHQDQAVKLVLFIGILCRHQVAKMHGIEAPAQKSDFHRGTVVFAPMASKAQLLLGSATFV